MTPHAISVKGVSKSFGPVEVLHNIDLDIEAGQVTCLIGPSGSGKSTLLRCMAFLEETTAGSILINGQPLRFYHFTKLGPTGDAMTRRYAGDNTEVYELWWWYRHEVARETDPAIPKGWWHYGTFDNGVAIGKHVRELFRDRQDLRKAYTNPYKTGPDSLFEWLKK